VTLNEQKQTRKQEFGPISIFQFPYTNFHIPPGAGLGRSYLLEMKVQANILLKTKGGEIGFGNILNFRSISVGFGVSD
jgi:hypothetical protein